MEQNRDDVCLRSCRSENKEKLRGVFVVASVDGNCLG